MKVHKFDITLPKPYTPKGATEEKTYFARVGTMTVFIKDDGSQSRIMHLHHLKEEYVLFPQKPREQKPTATVTPAPATASAPAPATVEYPTDDINPEDIPF